MSKIKLIAPKSPESSDEIIRALITALEIARDVRLSHVRIDLRLDKNTGCVLSGGDHGDGILS